MYASVESYIHPVNPAPSQHKLSTVGGALDSIKALVSPCQYFFSEFQIYYSIALTFTFDMIP